MFDAQDRPDRTQRPDGEGWFDGQDWLTSPTGARLALYHREATSTPRGILLIAHGLAEHAGRYGHFAEAMADMGFHVYAFDHRGHGLTTAPDAPTGRFALRDGWRMALRDLDAVRALAVGRHPGLPVALIGHSMGGLIALNAAVDTPQSFDAVAVWNSNLNPGLAGRAAQVLLLAERALKGSDVPSDLLPRLTFEAWGKTIPGHRTLFDWLSSDPQAVDAYIADPLCGFNASVSMWLDVMTLSFRAPTMLDRLPSGMPIHLVGGEDDPATRGAREIRWLADRLARSGHHRVTTSIWPKTRHETLKEPVRDRAVMQFAAWLDGNLPQPAPETARQARPAE